MLCGDSAPLSRNLRHGWWSWFLRKRLLNLAFGGDELAFSRASFPVPSECRSRGGFVEERVASGRAFEGVAGR